MSRGVLVTVGLVLFGLIIAGLRAADKPSSIKEVMANHKKDQLRQQIETDLKDEKPDWTDLQKKTKTYADQAKVLVDFDPPKGDKDDYKKLAKSFSDSINDLDKAAQAKDTKAANQAFEKSGTYCAMCHKTHKGS